MDALSSHTQARDGKEPIFYELPPETWESIVANVGRKELAALALASKRTYPHANTLLYKTLEISFCKCSSTYYDALHRTFTLTSTSSSSTNTNFTSSKTPTLLASLVTELLIDMRVPCQVKSTTSVDDLKSLSQSQARKRSGSSSRFALRRPIVPARANQFGNTRISTQWPALETSSRPQYTWNREAIETLKDGRVGDVISCLVNLKRATIVMGSFVNDPEIFLSIFKAIPAKALLNLEKLKIYDTPLHPPPFLLPSSRLRTLDLGYVNVSNSDLCSFVAQNANTLEEIRLSWIVVSSMVGKLFGGYTGSSLSRLRVLVLQGPQDYDLDGLKHLLSETHKLDELTVEHLSVHGANSLSDVFGQIINSDSPTSTAFLHDLRVLKVGAATLCTGFWETVSQILSVCGENLRCLHINGGPKGTNTPFAAGLTQYFLEHTQPRLETLVLVWRDYDGLPPEVLNTLGSFCPSVSLLHLYMRWPHGDSTQLPNQFLPFGRLQKLHLVFSRTISPQAQVGDATPTPTSTSTTSEDYAKAIKGLIKDLMGDKSLHREFMSRVAVGSPGLREGSWTVYDRLSMQIEYAKAYTAVKGTLNSANRDESRGTNPNPKTPLINLDLELEDLTEQVQNLSTGSNRTQFRCVVGHKKVLLNQKPGWREEMGNRFIETRRVCPYSDFVVTGAERVQRRDGPAQL